MYETPNQGNANATNIGWLRNNDSRLNVLSKLTAQDKQQVYKVNALSTADVSFTSQSDQNVHIQVYNANNQLVADSKPNQGAASDNYTAMTQSSYNMKAGTYYIKVSRAAGVSASTPVNYAMQILQGSSYKNDYVTTQVALTQDQRAQNAVSPTQDLPAGLVTYSSAGTLLNDAMSQSSSILGGNSVSFGSGGNILGVKNTV